MPARSPRPCRAPLCPKKTTERHGYCPEHEHLHSGWQRHHQGKSSTERGYGGRWRKLRALVMNRDQWLCQPCKRSGRAAPAAMVDHIVNKAEGGTDNADNLEAICRSCHQTKTQQEAARGRQRQP
mgnify:CR=1 FL=1